MASKRRKISRIILTRPLQVLSRIEIFLTVELLKFLLLPVFLLSFSSDLCMLPESKEDNNRERKEFLLRTISVSLIHYLNKYSLDKLKRERERENVGKL